MQPHVHERRGRPQDAGQSGSAHHAVRRTVPLEQPEDLLVLPAGVAQLDGDPDPPRQLVEEPAQARVVAFHGRRQLHEQHGAPVVELVPRRRDPLHPDLGRVELLRVRQPPRRLDRHPEPGRQAPAPARERRVAWPSVVARVQLDGVELARVEVEALRRRESRAGRARRPSGRSSTPRSRPTPRGQHRTSL